MGRSLHPGAGPGPCGQHVPLSDAMDLRRALRQPPLEGREPDVRGMALRSARLGVSQKCARKSARMAHELPSDELMSCAPGTKSLQIRTIFRDTERAREIRTSDLRFRRPTPAARKWL